MNKENELHKFLSVRVISEALTGDPLKIRSGKFPDEHIESVTILNDILDFWEEHCNDVVSLRERFYGTTSTGAKEVAKPKVEHDLFVPLKGHDGVLVNREGKIRVNCGLGNLNLSKLFKDFKTVEEADKYVIYLKEQWELPRSKRDKTIYTPHKVKE